MLDATPAGLSTCMQEKVWAWVWWPLNCTSLYRIQSREQSICISGQCYQGNQNQVKSYTLCSCGSAVPECIVPHTWLHTHDVSCELQPFSLLH